MAIHPFQLQLPDLARLLSERLFAEPELALRALLHNAHDAILRRQALAEARGDTPPPGRITLRVSESGERLFVEDNGCGLSAQEAREFLGTLGRSGTDPLRYGEEWCDADDWDEHDLLRPPALLGERGFGLLGAFALARSIELMTRAPGEPALCWSCEGGSGYYLSRGHRDSVGTTVTLTLLEEHARRFDVPRLRALVKRYADFLGTPVHVQKSPEPVNLVQAPWHRPELSGAAYTEALAACWRHRTPGQSALLTLPIDKTLVWTVRVGAYRDAFDEERRCRVRGLLVIPGPRPDRLEAQGRLELFIGGGHVAQDLACLLPPWAGGLQGVIECNGLSTTPTRTGVLFNEALEALTTLLGGEVLQALLTLAEQSPAQLQELLRLHGVLLTQGIPLDKTHRRLPEALALHAPHEAMKGARSLGECIAEEGPRDARGRRIVLALTQRPTAALQLALGPRECAGAFVLPDERSLEFFERCASRLSKRLSLRLLHHETIPRLFEALEGQEAERAETLLRSFQRAVPERGVALETRRFPSPVLPALLWEPSTTRALRRLRTGLEDGDLPAYLRAPTQALTQPSGPETTLYLNAAHPKVQDLLRRQRQDDDVAEGMLAALYDYASRMNDPDLSERETRRASNRLERVLALLLRLAPWSAGPHAH